MVNFDPDSVVKDLVEHSASSSSTFRPASAIGSSFVPAKSLVVAARGIPPKPSVVVPANRYAVLEDSVSDPGDERSVDQLAGGSPDA